MQENQTPNQTPEPNPVQPPQAPPQPQYTPHPVMPAIKGPGQGMLLVVGILYIIFSSFGILGAFLIIGGGGLIDSLAGTNLALLGFIALLFAGFNMAAGIAACAMHKKAESANTLFILGIVLVAIAVLDAIITGINAFTIIGFVLPILYLIGAHQNLTAVKNNNNK